MHHYALYTWATERQFELLEEAGRRRLAGRGKGGRPMTRLPRPDSTPTPAGVALDPTVARRFLFFRRAES